MIRAAVLLFVAAFIIAPSLAAAGPTERIGSAVQVVNQVSAEFDRDSRSLIAGDEVHQDELIAVGQDSIGELEFEDETKLALGPGAKLLLDKFVYNGRRAKSDIVVNLVKGAFRFITGLASKKSYRIRTPGAAITVRGTIFDVFVAEDDTVWVLLLEGGVTACNDRGSCSQLSRIGYILRIAPDGEITGPMPWALLPGRDEIGFATAFPFMINAPTISPDPPLTPEDVRDGDQQPVDQQPVDPEPIDPPSVIPTSCPAGWDRFQEFRGKPLGYYLRTFTSNGQKIICGEPRCEGGWGVYRKRSAIPYGWRKRLVGRPHSNYKFWCAKPRIEGCRPGRHEVKFDGICICKDGNERNEDGQCVGFEPPPPPPPTPICWYGWETIDAWQIISYRRKGYSVKPRLSAGRTVWCAKPGGPLPCWNGWETITRYQVSRYKQNGYTVRTRGRGDNITYCAKPPVCGKNEVRSRRKCVCKPGYSRDRSRRCVPEEPSVCPDGSKRFPVGQVPPGWKVIKSRFNFRGYVCAVPPPRNQCWSGWSQINRSEIPNYKRKGYEVKQRRRGSSVTWCARPGGKVCNPRLNEVKVNGRCACKPGHSRGRGSTRCVPGNPGGEKCKKPRYRNQQNVCTCGAGKRWTGSKCVPGGDRCKKPRYRNRQNVCTCGPKKRWNGKQCIRAGKPRTCKQVGKIGKWPNCRKKPPKKTCKQVGKIGTWPNCRKKPPKKTCKQVGKIGTWPNCRKKPPKKTCKQVGKIGTWPNCRKKPPKKTCKQVGKIGKWPNCRKKPPKKTCKQVGKIGKWPNCRKKPPKKTCKQVGKIGKWPNCRKKPPKKTCKQVGKIGKWPNCR